MTERTPVSRFVIHGAWIGALLGIALSLLLRSLIGTPHYFLPKAIAIVVIIAVFGGFVGALAEAFVRSRAARGK